MGTNATGVKLDTDRIPPKRHVSGVLRGGLATTFAMLRIPAFIAGVANLEVSQTRTYLQMAAMVAAAISTAQEMVASAKFVEMVKNQIWLKPGASRAEQATPVRKVDVPCAPLAGRRMSSRSSVMSVRMLRRVLMEPVQCVLTAKSRMPRRQAAKAVRMATTVCGASAFTANVVQKKTKTGQSATNVT